MDEMDYVMHSSEAPSTPQARQPPPGCPAWRPEHSPLHAGQNHPMLSPIRPSPHSPYDPVHGSPGPWYSPHSSPFPWPPAGPLSQQPPLHPHSSRPPISDPYFGSLNGGFGGQTGALPHAFLPNQQIQPSPQDPFGPALHFPFRHSSALPRLGNVPPSQASQQSRLPERDLQGSTPRSVGLPGLSFPSLPQPQQNMSASGNNSPPQGTSNRPPFPAAPDSPRGQTGGSAPLDVPTGPLNSASPQRNDLQSLPRPPRMSSHRPEAPGSGSSSAPPAAVNAERRRGANARLLRVSRRTMPHADGESDEDLDQLESGGYYRMMQEYSSGAPPYALRLGDMDERNLRAQQILRGQMVSKRVASRSAISSLQSVDIDGLPESERSCIICYNDFGVPNPEGINEAPLRLPKCKHVFGDHCIKKWFEESDSCPYCRDKVHSEPQMRATPESVRNFLRQIRSGAGLGGGAGGGGPGRYDGPPPHPGPIQRPDLMGSDHDWMREADLLLTLANRGDHLAYRQMERAAADPSLGWASSAGRRSPPDSSSENRRRTRPRHGSLRNSPPSTGGSASGTRPNSYMGPSPPSQPSAAQQQPPFPPMYGHRFHHHQHASHNNASSSSNRQPLPDPVMPYYHIPAMPLGLTPLSGPPNQYAPAPAMMGSRPDPQHFPAPLGNAPPQQPSQETRQGLPDSRNAGAFSQQFPPQGMDRTTGSAFTGLSGGNQSHY